MEDGEGYVAFKGRQAKGVLYRLNAMPSRLMERMEKYVHGGIMAKDMRYARAVFGLVNTSGRKDFEVFWESPWTEEHVQDAPKKRKLEAQQRSMAVRSYIRASSMQQEQHDVGKFIETVDQLTQWEDRHDAKDNIKTVSRMVQSFERTTIRSVASAVSVAPYTRYKDAVQTAFALNRPASDDADADTVGSCQIESTACWLRRNDQLFDLFATAVAAEIIWADSTNGTRTIPMHLCERLMNKKNEALLNLARTIYAQDATFAPDDVGMPLMEMDGSMCVSRGVLVVCPGGQSATYVLDIEQPHAAADGTLDLTDVRTITITRVMSDAAAGGRNA